MMARLLHVRANGWGVLPRYAQAPAPGLRGGTARGRKSRAPAGPWLAGRGTEARGWQKVRLPAYGAVVAAGAWVTAGVAVGSAATSPSR